MSSYSRDTINPATGCVELAEWLDDFYGRHQYGVRFPDGRVWAAEEIKLPPEGASETFA